jgi:hypothetical protein
MFLMGVFVEWRLHCAIEIVDKLIKVMEPYKCLKRQSIQIYKNIFISTYRIYRIEESFLNVKSKVVKCHLVPIEEKNFPHPWSSI